MKKQIVCKIEPCLRSLTTMRSLKFWIFIPSLVLMLHISIITTCKAQIQFLPPSPTYRPDRLKKVVLAESLIFAATSIGLYFLWYKRYPKSRFHFIRDGQEWFQMDKFGHATTAYSIANMHYDLMRWSGVNRSSAINTSIITSLAYLSIIELMDGFSRDWGFSGGDMLANLSGAALFAGQQYAWGEQRIGMRFSTHLTPFAKQNPALLGNNYASRLMKDYNGHTYWLSANIGSFLPSGSRFPVWPNIAIGTGANGMIRANKKDQEQTFSTLNSQERYRQWYLAPDAALYRIPATNGWNNSLYMLQFMKLPAPAIEWNSKRKFKLHPIYY